MHLSIIDDDAHVTGIRPGQRSLLHTSHNTFQDSRQETGIDGSTNDTVNKHQLSTPVQIYSLRITYADFILLSAKTICIRCRHTFVVRFDDQMNFTELPRTT